MPNKVFVADDEGFMRDIVEGTLGVEGYDVSTFPNGELLMDYVRISRETPNLVILDMNMPKKDGLQTSRELREEGYEGPIIGITGDLKENMYRTFFEQGFYDVLKKPFSASILAARSKNAIDNALIPSYEEMTNALVRTIGYMGDARDTDTQNHNQRLGEISYVVARGLGLDDRFSSDIKRAAIMHDIGKIAIPDEILRKPGKLTEEEFETIKTHTTFGASILVQLAENIPFRYIKLAQDIAYYHHEKLDGSGYPNGFKADNIPLEVRIVTVADIYDAVTMKRSYHPQQSHELGTKVIQEEAGAGKLDKEVVQAFMETQEEIKDIKEKFN